MKLSGITFLLKQKIVGESEFEAQLDVGIGSIQGKGWRKNSHFGQNGHFDHF